MRTVDAHVLLPASAAPTTKKRAASTIVAKDTIDSVDYCGELPSGDLLVVETPGYAEPPGRLLRRNGKTFAIEAELPGVNANAVLSPDRRRLLASGPLLRGEHASCVIVDLERWEIVRSLPLVRPFLWIDDKTILAQSPKWKTELENGSFVALPERFVDPAIAANAPALMGDKPGMVSVDLASGTSRLLLESRLLDEERTAALSPARDVLYTATGFGRVSAVRLSDGALLWQKPPVRLVTDGTISAIAFDTSRSQILAAGLGDHDLAIYEAESGREILRDQVGARLARAGLPSSLDLPSLAIREDGLIVLGTDKGTLVEIWPDDRWEAYKLASRAIKTLAFIRGGTTLVAGGSEKNLRLVDYPPMR